MTTFFYLLIVTSSVVAFFNTKRDFVNDRYPIYLKILSSLTLIFHALLGYFLYTNNKFISYAVVAFATYMLAYSYARSLYTVGASENVVANNFKINLLFFAIALIFAFLFYR
jgi:hypothetical protein